jgi:ribonuclease Z
MDKDLFTLPTEHFTIEGRSRAGHETWFRIRELGIALDIGRGPDQVVHLGHIFISHAHLDHAAGIPWYAGQRHLQGMEGGRVYVPKEAEGDFRDLLTVCARLTGGSFDDIEIVGIAEGQEMRVGRKLLVRGHSATHRVAARAYEFIELRHRLKPEFTDVTGDELARLRYDQVIIEEEYRCPILFYTGDTDRGILETSVDLYRAEVLIIECSFVKEGHQERAARYRHIHVDDLAEFAERFENRTIVLTHFSRRYSRDDIRDTIRKRLPASLRERVRLALPEPWQRV